MPRQRCFLQVVVAITLTAHAALAWSAQAVDEPPGTEAVATASENAGERLALLPPSDFGPPVGRLPSTGGGSATAVPTTAPAGGEGQPWVVKGWIQNSFTGNPAQPADGMNFGVNPNNLANRWMGNQYYIYLQRQMLEGGKHGDDFDWGLRVDSLFGNDWAFTSMTGMLNNVFVTDSFVGWQPVQFYAEAHLPVLLEGGINLRFGRWYTIIGYEGVPAIGRPLLSVPYMFNYGSPFTHMGALAEGELNDRVTIQAGTVNGWDRFLGDPGPYDWGFIGAVTLKNFDGNATKKAGETMLTASMVWGPNQFPRFLGASEQLYPAGYVNIPSAAGQPNPGYSSNMRTLFATVLQHRWTDLLTQVVEFDAGWEQNIPGLADGGSSTASANDAWFGLGNWVLYEVTEHVSLIWRGEWFRDERGSRTGYAGSFYEQTIGTVWKPVNAVWVRPELRFDWAGGARPYNGGRDMFQVTFGGDVTYVF